MVSYPGKHIYNTENKNDTYTVESVNADLRHYIPLLRRRSRCFPRSPETLDAVKAAFKTRRPKNGIIVHSDAGSQYTSEAYKRFLGKERSIQSMSDVGSCYDNARMESWFAALKKEKIYRMNTAAMTIEEVKQEVWRYTFAYYNTVRVYTVNAGGLPPSTYREKMAALQKAA